MKKYGLNASDLYQLEADLKKYAQKFEECTKVFLEMLADRGIEIAQMHEGDFAGYISYSRKWKTNSEEEQQIQVVAMDVTTIASYWYASAKAKTPRAYTISPLLMAEFGSGVYAEDLSGYDATPPEAGRGTLNVYGHAFDADGWYWYSDDATIEQEGNQLVGVAKNGRYKFHSSGNPPTRPLLSAVQELISDVEGIARIAFGGLNELD